MSTSLLLRERARSYRADPEVAEALATAGVEALRTPTLNPGESLEALRGDPSSFAEFDADAVGQRGYGFVRLNQLALEHLLGAR
jgi:xylose isomerase